jgi:hypothetical protein
MLLMCNCCSGSSYQVTLGAYQYNVSDTRSLTVISTVGIVHPGYNPSTFTNDVLLIRLPTSITLTREYCHIVMNI